jgi:hypothetical protein
VAARLEGLTDELRPGRRRTISDERVERVSVGLRSWEADADAGPDWQRPGSALPIGSSRCAHLKAAAWPVVGAKLHRP